MQLRLLLGAVPFVCPAVASAQAVSEWDTPGSLPVAIIEVAAGDLERAAARIASAPVLPAAPTAAGLHAVVPEGVKCVIGTLLRWELLVRLARRRAPRLVMAPPGKGGVRESRPQPGKG